MSTGDPERARTRAGDQLARQREASEAWAEHGAKERALLERTARLREMRLAKEAEDAASAPPQPSKPRGRRP